MKWPRRGKILPDDVAMAVANGLADYFAGDHGHRAKRLARMIGVSERTARHWIAGHHPPDAVSLLALVRMVPDVAARIDYLVGRNPAPHAADLAVLNALVQRLGGGGEAPKHANIFEYDRDDPRPALAGGGAP